MVLALTHAGDMDMMPHQQASPTSSGSHAMNSNGPKTMTNNGMPPKPVHMMAAQPMAAQPVHMMAAQSMSAQPVHMKAAPSMAAMVNKGEPAMMKSGHASKSMAMNHM